MSGPEQPWWVRPGGAPPPNAPPSQPAPWNPPPARPDPRRAPRHAAPQRPPAPRTPQPRTPPPPTPPPRPHARQPKSSPRRLVIGGAAVLLVVAVGLAVWQLRASSGTRLDVHQAQAGVAEILSNPIHGYGANNVAAVVCNEGRNPEVRVGGTFICQVDINGTLRQVTVEFTDDDGTYAVDGPR